MNNKKVSALVPQLKWCCPSNRSNRNNRNKCTQTTSYCWIRNEMKKKYLVLRKTFSVLLPRRKSKENNHQKKNLILNSKGNSFWNKILLCKIKIYLLIKIYLMNQKEFALIILLLFLLLAIIIIIIFINNNNNKN